MKKLIFITLFACTMVHAQTSTAQSAPVIVAQPSSTPYTVYTPSGSYLVVPNYTTGQPQAVIQVSKPAPTSSTTTGSKR